MHQRKPCTRLRIASSIQCNFDIKSASKILVAQLKTNLQHANETIGMTKVILQYKNIKYNVCSNRIEVLCTHKYACLSVYILLRRPFLCCFICLTRK